MNYDIERGRISHRNLSCSRNFQNSIILKYTCRKHIEQNFIFETPVQGGKMYEKSAGISWNFNAISSHFFCVELWKFWNRHDPQIWNYLIRRSTDKKKCEKYFQSLENKGMPSAGKNTFPDIVPASLFLCNPKSALIFSRESFPIDAFQDFPAKKKLFALNIVVIHATCKSSRYEATEKCLISLFLG